MAGNQVPKAALVTIGDGALRTTTALVGTTRVVADYLATELKPDLASTLYV